MLAKLVESLQAWLSTPQGLLGVSIIVVLGMILAFIMLILTFNFYSQLHRAEKERDKYKAEAVNLNNTLFTKNKDHEDITSSLRSALAERQRQLTGTSENLKLLDGKFTSQSKELLSIKTSLKDSEDHVTKLLRVNRELGVGTKLFTRVLSYILSTRAATVATWMYVIETDSKGNKTVATVNVTEAVEALMTTYLDYINVNFLRTKAHTHPDDENVKTVLNAIDALSTPSANDRTVSKVFCGSVLYVGSLKLRLFLTDYPLYLSGVADSADSQLNLILDKFNALETKKRVTEIETEIVYLSDELSSEMGGYFTGLNLFSKKFLDLYKPANPKAEI